MGLRIKNFNSADSLKNTIFRGRGVNKKPIYMGELPIGQFANLRGPWCFLGGIDTPMHTMGCCMTDGRPFTKQG